MTSVPAPIGYVQLVLAAVFILLAGGLSVFYRLGLAKDMVVGAVRAAVQLFAMGYVLTLIFRVDSPYLTLGVYTLTIAAAVLVIRGRVGEKQVRFEIPAFVSMLVSYMLITSVVTGAVVQAEPWWNPVYFLTMGGMIVGNSMTALSISMERLFSDLRGKRDEVEMRLSLGADYREAARPIVRDAIKAGMIPSINSMMAVGIVFLPGMMTGQVLSGTDPLLAVKYQLVVMLMLVASTALGSILVVKLCLGKCFGRFGELALTPIDD